ncbi:PP2C family protein-serine/threonine phosphatase [Streptomyces sp. NPDC006798]|uniref:PP2C family protein-serine/threonine phosphatase n=1 Tax=Streptomyces sp. NPDC006798 TaxID=3155462 RepID=UPI003410A58A
MIRSSSVRRVPAPLRSIRAVPSRVLRREAGTRPRPGPSGRRPLRRRLPALVLPLACGAAALIGRVVLPHDHPESQGERIVAGLVLLAAGTVGTALLLRGRRRLRRELRRARAVAHATQRVLLRPPPARLDGLSIAAGQLSASRGATVGGDLYEVVATPYGVRAVIGDVRGHGLPAIGSVAAVLGSFREAAYDEPDLGGVLRRLDRAVQRHLRERARDESAGRTRDARGEPGARASGDEPAGDGPAAGREPDPEGWPAEEFVTVLLLELGEGPTRSVRALNCGHPWPYRLGPGGVRPLAAAEPLPPLGPFPLPARLDPHLCEGLAPGEALLLHTDGAAEARDARGRFFALPAVLDRVSAAPSTPPADVLAAVQSALLRHTGGRPDDDVALLMLRNDRPEPPPRTPAADRRREPSRR